MYLAEGDALPDFFVYIFASFLLTVRLNFYNFLACMFMYSSCEHLSIYQTLIGLCQCFRFL